MTEAQIHKAVIQHWKSLGLPGTLVATIPNMGAMGQYGLTKGLPDLLVIGGDIKVGFIELKAENGRASAAQIAFRETCAEADVRCVVTWGRDEPIKLLEEWKIVRRAA